MYPNFYENDVGTLTINKISYHNERDIEKAMKYLNILTNEMDLDIYVPNLDYLTVRSLISGKTNSLGVRILKLRDWYFKTQYDDNSKHYQHLEALLNYFVYPKKYNLGKFIKELESLKDKQENQTYNKSGLQEEFGFNIIYYTTIGKG